MKNRKCFVVLVCLLLCAQMATAQQLVKILNLGENRYMHVDGGTGQYVYANKSGVGSLDVFNKVEFGNNVFALKCPSTGTYVSADSSGNHWLNVGPVTTPGNAEKFQLVWGGTNWAFKSVLYGYYVSAYTTGGQLSAGWTQVLGLYEQYSFSNIVDVYGCLAGWAANYPGKYKLANTAKWPSNTMKQVYIQNEQSFNAGLFWIYEECRDHNLQNPDPVWNYYGVEMIGDWEVVACYKTIPLGSSGWHWVEGIPRCVRYLAPGEVNNTPTHTVNWYTIGSGCSEIWNTSGPEYSLQEAPAMLDLSNSSSQENMGKRWTVDLGYKDGYEFWTLDIGPYDPNNPNTVNISPRYGFVRYHRHEPGRYDIET
ncbi:MAG: fascin domain-containing protein, partial [Armatimonadota bacterium]